MEIMHEILHIIGICPDSISHLDILDVLMSNYHEFINSIKIFRNGSK